MAETVILFRLRFRGRGTAIKALHAFDHYVAAWFCGRAGSGLARQGELRCEGKGAVVIRIAGVNGLASSRYPPIQSVWNRHTKPDADLNRLIVLGSLV